MAGLNAAESASNRTETDQKDQPDAKSEHQDTNISQLHPADRKRMENEGVTFKQIAAELLQHKAAAEAELRRLTTIKPETEEDSYLDVAEYQSFQRRIKETKSPEDAKRLVDEIQDYPSKKRALNKKDNEKRDINDPELKVYLEKIDKLFDRKDVQNWIGTKQERPFRQWCKDEIAKNPNIKTAKDIIYKLHHDRNGLKPRQEFYERTIQPKLKQYGVSLSEAEYLRQEGLSERQDAMSAILESEKILEGMRNTGLYSFKAKQKIIRGMLKSSNIEGIKAEAKMIHDVTRNESEQFTSQNSSIFRNTMVSVHGISVRAMSETSVKTFLADYGEYDMKTRADTVLHWKKIVENEGKLVKELGEIYEDDPEGFKKAIGGFALLPYMQKEKALKEHRKMQEKNDQEILHESLNILQRSLSAIDKAQNDKTLSNKTAKRFKAFVQKTANYSNEKTGEIDLKKQEDLYTRMTSSTPVYDKANRNIAAYAAGRRKFSNFLIKFAKDNPEVNHQEIRDWQDDYDEGGFKERKETYLELKEESRIQEEERVKNKKTEDKLHITKSEKDEVEKNSPEKSKLVEAVKEYIVEKSPESIEKGLTAIYLYFAFSKAKISDDPEIKGLRDKLEELESKVGAANEDTEQDGYTEMLDEVEETIDSDPNINHELDELDYTFTASELVEESERHHGNNTDARKRSEKEALANSGDELEDDIIESFYKQSDSETIINEEDTGDQITKVEFGKERTMTTEERHTMEDLAYDEQSRNFQSHQGTTKIQFQNQGKVLNADGRENVQQDREAGVIDLIASKLLLRRQKTSGLETPSDFSNLAERTAARRAAEQKVKERVESNIEKN